MAEQVRSLLPKVRDPHSGRGELTSERRLSSIGMPRHVHPSIYDFHRCACHVCAPQYMTSISVHVMCVPQ